MLESSVSKREINLEPMRVAPLGQAQALIVAPLSIFPLLAFRTMHVFSDNEANDAVRDVPALEILPAYLHQGWF